MVGKGWPAVSIPTQAEDPQELGQATPPLLSSPSSSIGRTATASILHLQDIKDLIFFF